jgi:hypothetical protein
MALRDIDEKGRAREMVRLDHQREFDRIWLSISPAERAAIEREINRRLDDLIASPNPKWGAITNTSIEGGQVNPYSGIRVTGQELFSTRYIKRADRASIKPGCSSAMYGRWC